MADGNENKLTGEQAPEKVGDNTLQTMEQKLLAAIADLAKRVDTKTDELKTEMKSDVDGIKTQLTQLQKSMGDNTKKVQDLENSVSFAHKDISDLKEKVKQVETENKRLKNRLDNAEKGRKEMEHVLAEQKTMTVEGLNDLERHSRGFSIRVKGVKGVKSGDNFRKTVAQVLVAQKLVDTENTTEVADNMIEHAHPIGKKKPGDDRTIIIASLYSRPERNSILSKARQLEYDENAPRVVEDMTKIDFRRKMAAYPIMKAAYGKGQKATFRRGQLIVDGKIVPVN